MISRRPDSEDGDKYDFLNFPRPMEAVLLEGMGRMT